MIRDRIDPEIVEAIQHMVRDKALRDAERITAGHSIAACGNSPSPSSQPQSSPSPLQSQRSQQTPPAKQP